MNIMINGELWFFYALVFGTVLLAVQGLYILLFKTRQENSAINRRLVLTAQLNNPNEVLEALRRERGVEFLLQHALFQGLNNLVVQSGKRMSAMTLITIGSVLLILYFALLRFALGWTVLPSHSPFRWPRYRFFSICGGLARGALKRSANSSPTPSTS